MPDTLFLADEAVRPCEVVSFALISVSERDHPGAPGSKIHDLYLEAVCTSRRFTAGRIYVVRTSTLPGRSLDLTHGVVSGQEFVSALTEAAAAKLKAGDHFPDALEDGLAPVGVFYPTREQAAATCAAQDQ